MTGNYLPAAMRASDADRDAVLSDLGDHFQAGRLTAAELEERTGRALAARTWGELGELVADLPAARPASGALASSAVRPLPPSGHAAPPLIAVLAGVAITAVVLVNVTHGGWGLIWPLLAVLLIARPMIRRLGATRHCG
jgi:hypothetical protein